MAALSSSRSLCPPHRTTRSPLQDLPPDFYLLPPTLATSSNLGTSTKRPVSPGTPALYTPAKRRLLNDQSHFATKIPLSTTAIPSSTAPSTAKHFNKTPSLYFLQHQQSTTRFTDALMGPDSPARKLDFGAPKNGALCQAAADDCFLATSQPRIQPPQFRTQFHNQTSLLSSLSSSSSHSYGNLEFLSASRELPPPVDPQSEHYPGFVVYQDPHIFIPTLRLTSPAPPSTPSSTIAPLDRTLDDDSDMEAIDSRELVKENLPPRRKVRKTTTPSVSEKAVASSSPGAKSPLAPATPPPEYLLGERDILTPKHLAIFGVGVGSGLGRAHHTPTKKDRRSMRRILEDEVDGE